MRTSTCHVFGARPANGPVARPNGRYGAYEAK
jgi:hypothetical protein